MEATKCLLVEEGASGQSGSSKQLLVILAERVSRGGQHWRRRRRGANSGKAIRASLQQERERCIWLVGDQNQRQVFIIVSKGTHINRLLSIVCTISFETSILLFGRVPFRCLLSSHVITLGLRPGLPNQLPLRFDGCRHIYVLSQNL